MNTTTIERNGRKYAISWERDLCVATDLATGVSGTGYSVGAALRNTRGPGR